MFVFHESFVYKMDKDTKNYRIFHKNLNFPKYLKCG